MNAIALLIPLVVLGAVFFSFGMFESVLGLTLGPVTDGVATLDKADAFSGTIAAITNIIPLMVVIVIMLFIGNEVAYGADDDDDEDDCDEEDDVELRCEYCKSRNVPPCETCHACGAPLR